jgi:hypothetical protein
MWDVKLKEIIFSFEALCWFPCWFLDFSFFLLAFWNGNVYPIPVPPLYLGSMQFVNSRDSQPERKLPLDESCIESHPYLIHRRPCLDFGFLN